MKNHIKFLINEKNLIFSPLLRINLDSKKYKTRSLINNIFS